MPKIQLFFLDPKVVEVYLKCSMVQKISYWRTTKMRTYEYPDFVDKEKIDMDAGVIEGTNFKWRSVLIIPFKGAKKKKKKVITFLMKNPSIANKIWTDKTIYNVLHYVKRLGEVDERFTHITEVRILNLYPIYSTDSTKLFEIIKAINGYRLIHEKNEEDIVGYLSDSDYIVPSWGKKPNNIKGRINPYQKRAVEMLKVLSSYPAAQLFLIKFNQRRTLFPIHPERIGYFGDKIFKFMLYPYKVQGNKLAPK
jgi:hypothetical protein